MKQDPRHESLKMIDNTGARQPHTHLNGFPKRDEERRHAEVLGRAVVAKRVIGVLAAAGSRGSRSTILATAVPTSSRKGGHRGQRKKSPERHRCELTQAWHCQVQHRTSSSAVVVAEQEECRCRQRKVNAAGLAVGRSESDLTCC